MTVNQISIFLENKYGKLSEILALLAEEKIRIIAATIADTSEYGILRIIVSDPQKAYKILKSNNVSANLTDVLAIVTNSCAGSFAETLRHFTKAGLTIEYMYCFSMNEKQPGSCPGSDSPSESGIHMRKRLNEIIKTNNKCSE